MFSCKYCYLQKMQRCQIKQLDWLFCTSTSVCSSVFIYFFLTKNKFKTRKLKYLNLLRNCECGFNKQFSLQEQLVNEAQSSVISLAGYPEHHILKPWDNDSAAILDNFEVRSGSRNNKVILQKVMRMILSKSHPHNSIHFVMKRKK